MKYLVFYIICFFFFTSYYSFSQSEILENYKVPELSGKIRSFKKTYYEYEFDNLNKIGKEKLNFINFSLIFNRKGEILLNSKNENILQFKKIQKIEYTNEGFIKYLVSENDSVSVEYKNNNLSEVKLYDQKRNLLKFEQFKYSVDGLITKKYLGWKNYKIVDSTFYSYNSNSLVSIHHYSWSLLNKKTIINYHQNGQKATELKNNYSINRYDTLCKSTLDSFSIDGKLITQKIQVKRISWEKKQKENNYKHGEIGVEALREFPEDYERRESLDPFVQTFFYKYNSDGLLISIEHSDENFIVYRKDYFKYDAFKNCIEEGILLNDVEYPIYINQIEYY